MNKSVEAAANVLNAASILLAGVNSVHTWWVGIVGCLLFGWVFFSTQLYADVTLQTFFIVTSLIGWQNWLRGNDGTQMPVRRTSLRPLLVMVLAAAVVASLYGWLLHRFTNARDFNTAYVAEFGRELWEAKSGTLTFEDMRQIAEAQIRREEKAATQANRFLFCDTSPLTTLFYSRHLFGKADPDVERFAERVYDFTILCAPDFTFVQDGTRQQEAFRMLQHEWYLAELSRRNIDYLLATGSIEARIRQVRNALTSLISPAR